MGDLYPGPEPPSLPELLSHSPGTIVHARPTLEITPIETMLSFGSW